MKNKKQKILDEVEIFLKNARRLADGDNISFHKSLIPSVIKEFNNRYTTGINTFMELENIDRNLNDTDRKYEALKNFTRNYYNDNNQMIDALMNIDKKDIIKLL